MIWHQQCWPRPACHSLLRSWLLTPSCPPGTSSQPTVQIKQSQDNNNVHVCVPPWPETITMMRLITTFQRQLCKVALPNGFWFFRCTRGSKVSCCISEEGTFSLCIMIKLMDSFEVRGFWSPLEGTRVWNVEDNAHSCQHGTGRTHQRNLKAAAQLSRAEPSFLEGLANYIFHRFHRTYTYIEGQFHR